MQKENDRNGFIDYLRGIAAIMVVVYHSIQVNYPFPDENGVFKALASAQMLPIMLVSGLILQTLTCALTRMTD